MSDNEMLEETIKTQRKQIAVYEQKLKEIIRAYKTIVLEKGELQQKLDTQSSCGAGEAAHSSPSQPDADALTRERSLIKQLEQEIRALGETNKTLVFDQKRQQARTVDLEDQLTEVVHSLAASEQGRNALQSSLKALQEERDFLDSENEKLKQMQQSHSSEIIINNLNDYQKEDLMEQLKKLVAILKPQMTNSSLWQLLNLGFDGDHEQCADLHNSCHEKYDRLKREFEAYKAKMKQYHSAKTMQKEPVTASQAEVDELKQHLRLLQMQLATLSADRDNIQTTGNTAAGKATQTLTELKLEHAREMNQMKSYYNKQVSELENELSKQRDRVRSVIADKDRDISSLKLWTGQPFDIPLTLDQISAINNHDQRRKLSSRNSWQTSLIKESNLLKGRHSSASGDIERSASCETSPGNHMDAIGSLSSTPTQKSSANAYLYGSQSGQGGDGGPTSTTPQFSPNKGTGVIETGSVGGGGGGSSVLHLADQVTRLNRDLATLTLEKRELDGRLCELQHEFVAKELRNVELVDHLKENIQCLTNQVKRSTDPANLEYLKNVLIRYMTCSASTGKAPMVKAIGTLLKFSPKEVELVLRHNGR